MENWQEWVAVGVAFMCAIFVVRDFVRPFLSQKGCGSCGGGCHTPKNVGLQIEPVKAGK